eukprot:TRINITY_DN10271_c0_g1_i1.p1 TRINITY_DN10271_c0_g1~~TRINITY_DN10271_c0_g1_i1.p1  ORF type:complete len:340 (-),score=30.11 TRINITY_DN10271_c0_g1_i1:86-1105(-)
MRLSSLKRLWKVCHPDIFYDNPKFRLRNQKSMQVLTEFFDVVRSPLGNDLTERHFVTEFFVKRSSDVSFYRHTLRIRRPMLSGFSDLRQLLLDCTGESLDDASCADDGPADLNSFLLANISQYRHGQTAVQDVIAGVTSTNTVLPNSEECFAVKRLQRALGVSSVAFECALSPSRESFALNLLRNIGRFARQPHSMECTLFVVRSVGDLRGYETTIDGTCVVPVSISLPALQEMLRVEGVRFSCRYHQVEREIEEMQEQFGIRSVVVDGEVARTVQDLVRAVAAALRKLRCDLTAFVKRHPEQSLVGLDFILSDKFAVENGCFFVRNLQVQETRLLSSE